jgi:small conductance mechanosensitive channel
MRRLLAHLLIGFVLLGAGLAQAQAPAGLPIPAAGPAKAAPLDPAAQRAQLEALIQTLQNDQARAQLVDQLKALSTSQAQHAAEPDTAIKQLQQAASERAQNAVEAVVGLGASVEAVPELAAWLRSQLTDEVSRVVWWTVLSQTGLAILLGVAASLSLRFLLRGWREQHTRVHGAAASREKLTVAGAQLLVDLLGLLAFLGVTYAALQLLDVTYLARAVAMDLLSAAAIARMITAASRALLATRNPRARLVSLSDAQARTTRRWISILSGVAIYGHAYLTAALRVGLPWTVHAFLQHLLFLVVTVLVVLTIFRVRGQMAALIRTLGQDSDDWLQRLLPWDTLATVVPYVIALWVVLQYLVWALRIPQGTALLTRGAIGTILAIGLLRVLNMSLDRRLRRTPERPSEDATEEQEQAPASTGRTLLVTGLRMLGAIAAAAVALQAWGFSITDWLATDGGQEVMGRTLGVLVVSALAGLAWYTVDHVAQRYITAQDAEGNLIHDNRTRTLANIVRNLALTVALFVVIGHLLTELGVNTAAILAGAGVVGFAIGFGSQKLVQDLTTGLFILLGDTVRVGDVVQLGDRGGVVEAVSMRTVTLRDYNGVVHTIPYSSISIVANMTKDYAFAVFRITVGYREDVDRVMDVLREIDSQLRREWPYRRIMLEPLQVDGVDAFTETGVVVLARSRTRAGEQWKVGREFNRRLKNRFDELGIEFPVPQQTVHVVEQLKEPVRRSFTRPEVVRAEARGGEA